VKYDHDRGRYQADWEEDLDQDRPPRRPAPGKRTLTDSIPVQRRAKPDVRPAQKAPDITPFGFVQAYGGEIKEPASEAFPDEAPVSWLSATADRAWREAFDFDYSKPVQREATATADVGTDAVHTAAARGLEAPSQRLPHFDQIQQSFGHHDVSHVEAHVGGAAAEASAAMGAKAYAAGDHVAFANSPDPHTAAHEAAHVVQQKGGVQLKGGVGEAGDSYERHADAVADKVVAGESAEALLDQMAVGASSSTTHSASTVQRQEAADRSADRYRNQGEHGGQEVDAQHYFRAYLATNIAPAISDAWRSKRFSLKNPRLEWTEHGREAFAYEVAAKIEEIFGDAPDRGLVQLLSPTNLWKLVDKNRLITNKSSDARYASFFMGDKAVPSELQGVETGPLRWVPDVAVAIRSRLEERIIAALPKIATRYVAVHDQKQAVAQATKGKATHPTAAEIIPGHPIERVIIHALCEGDMVRVEEKHDRAASKAESHAADQDAAPRKPRALKSLHWVTEKGMWNWVKVEPADATAEEVAYHLWKDYNAAERLTASAPFFAVRVDEAAKFPEARFNRGHGASHNIFDRMDAANEAANVTVARAEVDQDAAFDPSAQLLKSKIATEAGMAQAARVEVAEGSENAQGGRSDSAKGQPPPADDKQAYQPVLTQLRAFVRMVAPLGLNMELVGVLERTEARNTQLEQAPTETAPKLAKMARLQHAVLLQIGQPLATIMAGVARRAPAADGKPAAGPASASAAAMLVRAAAHSDLPETARAELARALEQQRTATIDVMEALLADALGRVEALTMDRGQVRGEMSKSQALFGSLSARQRGLREHVAQLRSRMLEGESVAEAEIRNLLTEIDALHFEADVLTKLNEMRSLFEAIDEMLKSDWVLLAGQGMDLHNVRLGGQKLRDELRIAHQSWTKVNSKEGDIAKLREAGRAEEAAALVASQLEGAKARLHKLASEENVRAYLQKAYEEIEDANTRAMLTQIAVFIGVSMAASAVGGAVAMGATGARTVESLSAGGRVIEAMTQSAIVSGFNASMSDQKGDSFAAMFATDLITNAAMFSNLAALDEVVKGTKMARVLEGTEEASLRSRAIFRSLDMGLRMVTIGGTQAAGMQMDSVVRYGHSMSGEDLLANGEMGLALMITHGVINRLKTRPLDHIGRFGADAEKLLAKRAELENALAEAEHSPSPEQARKFLAEERKLYELEALELRRRVNEIGAGNKKLESQLASAETHQGEAIARQGAEVVASAGLDTVVPGRSYAGSAADIDQAAARLRDLGFKTRVDQDGGQRRIEATSPDGKGLIELLERPGAKSGAHDAAPAGRVILQGADTEIEEFAQRVKPKPGTLDVFLHGEVDDFVVYGADGTKHYLDHRSLARYIEKSGKDYRRIRLISCKTGLHAKGAAQHLVNKLHGEVVEAPTDLVHIAEDGSMTIGPRPGMNTGKWEEFRPKAAERRFTKAKDRPPERAIDRLHRRRDLAARGIYEPPPLPTEPAIRPRAENGVKSLGGEDPMTSAHPDTGESDTPAPGAHDVELGADATRQSHPEEPHLDNDTAVSTEHNERFDDKINWQATRPKGTLQNYEVRQRTDINWDFVRTHGDARGKGLTNREAGRKYGLAPQLDEAGHFATLHHIGQDSRGPLVEASTEFHGVGSPYQDTLHSQYGRNKPHPTHQPDRKKFDVDDREYWKWRASNAQD
jgi:hypothetical protein